MNAHSSISRRQALGTLALAGAAASGLARAQNTSDKPLTFVVGLPAGGAADAVLRVVVQQLEKNLDRSIVVLNKPGGLYQIAVQAVLAAPADGNTVMYANSSFVAVQVIQKRFNLRRDFAPVVKVTETAGVLLVRADSKLRTIKDLVEFGKANPGILKYATLGTGTYEHLAGAAFEKAAGFQAMPVPYKGSPEAINAVVAGDIDYLSVNTLSAVQFLKTGRVHALATVSPTRLEPLPDVPTLAESGLQWPVPRLWGGYMVRAGTPATIIQQLHDQITRAVNSPAVALRLKQAGYFPYASKSPADLQKAIDRDEQWITQMARTLNLSGS